MVKETVPNYDLDTDSQTPKTLFYLAAPDPPGYNFRASFAS